MLYVKIISSENVNSAERRMQMVGNVQRYVWSDTAKRGNPTVAAMTINLAANQATVGIQLTALPDAQAKIQSWCSEHDIRMEKRSPRPPFAVAVTVTFSAKSANWDMKLLITAISRWLDLEAQEFHAPIQQTFQYGTKLLLRKGVANDKCVGATYLGLTGYFQHMDGYVEPLHKVQIEGAKRGHLDIRQEDFELAET